MSTSGREFVHEKSSGTGCKALWRDVMVIVQAQRGQTQGPQLAPRDDFFGRPLQQASLLSRNNYRFLAIFTFIEHSVCRIICAPTRGKLEATVQEALEC